MKKKYVKIMFLSLTLLTTTSTLHSTKMIKKMHLQTFNSEHLPLQRLIIQTHHHPSYSRLPRQRSFKSFHCTPTLLKLAPGNKRKVI